MATLYNIYLFIVASSIEYKVHKGKDLVYSAIVS